MQNNTEIQQRYEKYLKTIVFFLGILAAIGIGFIMLVTRSFLLPVLLAVFIYFIFDPVIRFFEGKKIPTWLSIFLTFLVFLLIFLLIGTLLSKSVQAFAESSPIYEKRINDLVTQVQKSFDIPDNFLSGDWKSDPYLKNLMNNFSITGIVRNILSSISNFFSKNVLVMLFLLFILIGRNQFMGKLQVAYSKRIADRLVKVIKNIHDSISTYIVMQTLISFVTALLVMAVLALFGMDFVVVWGLLTFLLNFIPNIGPIFAVIFPIIFAFLQFDNRFTVLWIVVALSVIHFIIGNFLNPKIMGKSMNLSPLLVLFALLFWGWLWGIVGMFLAIPLTVAVKIIFENIDGLRPISVLMGGSPDDEKKEA